MVEIALPKILSPHRHRLLQLVDWQVHSAHTVSLSLSYQPTDSSPPSLCVQSTQGVCSVSDSTIGVIEDCQVPQASFIQQLVFFFSSTSPRRMARAHARTHTHTDERLTWLDGTRFQRGGGPSYVWSLFYLIFFMTCAVLWNRRRPVRTAGVQHRRPGCGEGGRHPAGDQAEPCRAAAISRKTHTTHKEASSTTEWLCRSRNQAFHFLNPRLSTSASGSPRRHEDREHGGRAQPQRGRSSHRPGPGAACRPG